LLTYSLITSSSTLASDGFLYNLITLVILQANTEYAVVGAYTQGEPEGYTADSGVITGPQLTFNGYAYDNNSSLDLPTNAYSPAIFGPTFQYAIGSDVAAPEPSAWVLAILVVFLFGILRLRVSLRLCASRVA
jgi:hypothetical protein